MKNLTENQIDKMYEAECDFMEEENV